MADELRNAAVPAVDAQSSQTLPFNFVLQLDASIGGFPMLLAAGLQKDPSGSESTPILAGRWTNTGEATTLAEWLARIFPDASIPEFFDFPLSVNDFTVVMQPGTRLVKARLGITPFGGMAVTFRNNEFSFSIPANDSQKPFFKLHFSDLPLIGGMLPPNDRLELKCIAIAVKNRNVNFQVALEITLGGLPSVFDIAFEKGAAEPNAPDMHCEAENAGGTAAPSAGERSQIFWVDAQKKLGIFSLRKIGLEMGASSVALYLDAGFALGPISVDFFDLAINVPLKDIKDFSVALGGLAVSLEKPPLTLSGGLYYDKTQNMYTGELMVGVATFRLTALGSYGIMQDGTHSLFAYLVLLADLGGPPFLFITGIAGGFGLNRILKLPEKVEDVSEFPFVQAAMGGKSGASLPVKPSAMLKTLGERVQPTKDAYFISAGLRFTSFGLLDSFVLLNVEFGNSLRISVLGLSTLCIPPKAESRNEALAYACLAIKATFSPDDGILAIMGVLTNDSFVLDKNCKLTGGFAVYAWTAGEHAGDFVVTFGGYHPSFRKPEHYPVVPPLGLSWNITSDLSLRGSIYFALTPSAVMAGGQLSLTYQKGNLKAWLTAYAHFLMEWKPFHYDVQIGVSVGVSYKIAFLFIRVTLTIELSAQLHLWGPEFSGTARITVFFISFTIGFGHNAQTPPPLTWDQFRSAFLNDGALCEIQISSGISGEIKNNEGDTRTLRYLIKPADFSLRLTSRLPLCKVTMDSEPLPGLDAPLCGIKPMRKETLKATLRAVVVEGAIQWDKAVSLTENAPSALWGQQGDPPDAGLVKVLRGVELRPKPTFPENHLPRKNGKESSYSLATLTANQQLDCGRWTWSAATYPGNKNPVPKGARLQTVKNTICGKDVTARRARIAALFDMESSIALCGNWRTESPLIADPVCCPSGYRPLNEEMS